MIGKLIEYVGERAVKSLKDQEEKPKNKVHLLKIL